MSEPLQKRNPAVGRGFAKSQTNGGGLQGHSTGARVEVLLARLDGVQKTGKGWRARCPACGGQSRKLAISEGNDGTLLLHCFACNDIAAILSAIGLEIADLFPERVRDMTPEGRRAAQQAFKQTAWAAALGVLALEADVVFIASGMLRSAEVLTDADHERLGVACERIQSAKEVLQ